MGEVNLILAMISYSMGGILPLIFFNNIIINRGKERTLSILYLILTVIVFFITNKSIVGIIYIITIYVYIHFKYSMSINIKIFLFIQFIIINLSISIIFILLTSYNFNYKISMLVNGYDIIGVLTRIFILLSQYLVIFVLFKNNDLSIIVLEDKKIYIVFMIITYMNLYLLIIICIDSYKLDIINLGYLIKCITNLMMNYLFFRIINLLSKEYRNNKRLSIEKERLEAQTRYIEEIEHTHKKIRELKHDYNNHLNIITNLALSNKSKYVADYIKEIEKRFLSTDIICQTDNIIIDSLVNSKYIYANSNEIEFDLKINKIGKINILDTDLCSLIGNLLDNAIEGAFKSERKYINLEIKKSKKYLAIKIYNTTNGIVNYKDGKFLTTKNKENHGIGLNKVNDIVNDYNGYMKIKYDEKIFEVNVFLLVF